MSSLSKTFKALSDPTRRKILELLKKGALTAGEISEQFPISPPSITHHLNLLKDAELIAQQRDGRQLIYSLNLSVIEEILKSYYENFSAN